MILVVVLFGSQPEVTATLPSGAVLDDPQEIVFRLPDCKTQSHNLQWMLKTLG